MRKFETNGKVVSGGAELVIPSLWVPDDYKCHMSINLDSGLWRCFKTSRVGNFMHLYAELEDVSYRKATSDVMVDSYLTEATSSAIQENLVQKKGKVFDCVDFIKTDCIRLDIHSSPNYTANDHFASLARTLVLERKLELKDFYISYGISKYANRLIIPYFWENEVVFFQARAVTFEQFPKYLNFDGCKSSDILYPFDEDADELVVTEGPLCCITLKKCGINATCINGSMVSRNQALMFKQFQGKLIIAFDQDDAGRAGIDKFDKLRLSLMMPSFWYCQPPIPYKDWNEMYVKLGGGLCITTRFETHTERHTWDKALNY